MHLKISSIKNVKLKRNTDI